MTSEDCQKLRAELAGLSRDLAKGLNGLSFMIHANKEQVDQLKSRFGTLEQSGHKTAIASEERLLELAKAVEDAVARIAVLEKTPEPGDGGATKKEDNLTISGWKFYAALVFLAIPGLLSFFVSLLHYTK